MAPILCKNRSSHSHGKIYLTCRLGIFIYPQKFRTVRKNGGANLRTELFGWPS